MSITAFLLDTAVRATPFILLGLAVALAFSAGVLNIGAEGQFLAGATASIAVGLWLKAWPGLLIVCAELATGVVAGALWSGIAAVLKRRYGVLEVISTLMLNFVALYCVSYLVRGPLAEPTHLFPQTSSLAHAARLPVVLPGSQLHLGFVLAIMLAAGLWWVLGATAIGFRVRAVGAGVAAAAAAGRVHVARTVFRVFLASGGIAGLAGAAETTGRTFALYDGSPGFGYTAIAVALLARLNPLAVVASGIFFGALEASAAALQRDAGLPFALVTAVEAMIVLGVLAVERLGAESRVPAAAMPETA